MAAASERFSIREYVLNRRKVDVAKCWPFGSSGDGEQEKTSEEIDKLLPPLTYRKYRWWLEELEVIRSQEVVEDNTKIIDETGKTVSGVESSGLLSQNLGFGAGNMASGVYGNQMWLMHPVSDIWVDLPIESSLMQRSKYPMKMEMEAGSEGVDNPKARKPRKRSLMDIFKVTEQIEKFKIDKEESSLDDEEANEISEESTNMIMDTKRKKVLEK